MNTQERWNYIKNNKEIIEQYMALHDEEVRTRQLVKFLDKQPPSPKATNEIRMITTWDLESNRILLDA
jgi:hypothetical protein